MGLDFSWTLLDFIDWIRMSIQSHGYMVVACWWASSQGIVIASLASSWHTQGIKSLASSWHQNVTTFLTRIYSPHPLFSGFGNLDAVTNLEFFRGSSWWTDWTQGTFLEGKSTSFRETTTIVFYAATALKKQHFICSSAAPLAKPVGNTLV
jgi:hypothetical protein